LPTVKADWLFLDNTATATAIDNAALDGAVVTGDAVYYDSTSSTFKKALANGAAPQKIIGFAHVASSRVFMTGIIGFLTGLTAGNTYYLSTTTAGALTTIIPTINAVAVGFSKSTTELMINIQGDSFNPADLFTASIVTNGYEKNNETGLLKQWGTTGVFPSTGTTVSTVSVVFPIPFSGLPFSIVLGGTGSANSLLTLALPVYQNVTNSGMDIGATPLSGSTFSASSFVCSWAAYGN
jgi:hypothetical protein